MYFCGIETAIEETFYVRFGGEFMRDLYDIKCDLEEMANMSCKPSTPKPRTGDVIDEDKSVKWNREEVIRLQNTYEEEVKALNTAKNKRRDDLYKELYKVIRREVKGITINDAQQIFQYAYSEGHSYGYNEVFNKLYDIILLISRIANHEND